MRWLFRVLCMCALSVVVGVGCDWWGCVSEEDCIDGNPCTSDECHHHTGECANPPSPGWGTPCVFEEGILVRDDPRWPAEIVVGTGICEAGACVGPCDSASEEELPCPIEGFEDLFCCPGMEACVGQC